MSIKPTMRNVPVAYAGFDCKNDFQIRDLQNTITLDIWEKKRGVRR